MIYEKNTDDQRIDDPTSPGRWALHDDSAVSEGFLVVRLGAPANIGYVTWQATFSRETM